jgi:molybdopterin-guanine dinucleotide biosynthesis protein A
MNRRSGIVGALLAGGKSTRMGRDKALLPLNGLPMIQHIAEMLSSVFQDVIIVGDKTERLEFLRLPIIPDIFHGCGPLAGIHSALLHSNPHPCFVLACDAPSVSRELLEYVLDFAASTETRIASIHDIPQPLCGVYSSGCLSSIERNLRRGTFGVLRTLRDIEHSIVPITPDLPFYTPQLLRNINWPEEYREVCATADLR